MDKVLYRKRRKEGHRGQGAEVKPVSIDRYASRPTSPIIKDGKGENDPPKKLGKYAIRKHTKRARKMEALNV